MTKLNTSANINRPDDFYQRRIAVHEGLEKSKSDALNARLILILANHIGDTEVLKEALALASETPHPTG